MKQLGWGALVTSLIACSGSDSRISTLVSTSEAVTAPTPQSRAEGWRSAKYPGKALRTTAYYHYTLPETHQEIHVLKSLDDLSEPMALCFDASGVLLSDCGRELRGREESASRLAHGPLDPGLRATLATARADKELHLGVWLAMDAPDVPREELLTSPTRLAEVRATTAKLIKDAQANFLATLPIALRGSVRFISATPFAYITVKAADVAAVAAASGVASVALDDVPVEPPSGIGPSSPWSTYPATVGASSTLRDPLIPSAV